MLFGDVFKVLEDAPLEVEHVLHPLADQVVRRFLTPDTAGAEHRDFLVVEPVLIRLPPGGEFAKALGFRVDGPVECADRDLIVIARVDHGNIVAADQIVPVGGIDVMPDLGQRIDIGLTHGHDLALQADLHLAEGRRRGGAFLPLKIGAAGQGTDMRDDRVYPRTGAGDGAVNAFGGDKQRAFDVMLRTKRNQRRAQGVRRVKTAEMIEGGNGIHAR